MRFVATVCACPLVFLGTVAVAQEVGDDDVINVLRVTGSRVPGADRADEENHLTSNTGTTTDLDLTSSRGRSADVGFQSFRFAPGEWYGYDVYGALMLRRQQGEDGTGATVRISTVGVDAGLDLALRTTTSTPVLFTIGPRLGLGLTYQQIDLPGYKSATGAGFSFAGQAGVYVPISHVLVGVEGGYMTWDSSATHDYSTSSNSGTIKETFRGRGATFGATIGYVF